MKRLSVLLIYLLLSGCINAGVKVEQSKLDLLKPGVSTYDDMVRTLGPPVSTTANSDGTKTATYVFFGSSSSAASYIPYVNLIAGDTKGESQTVSFQFDAHSILKSYSSSSSVNCSKGGTIGAMTGGANPTNCNQ
jgi:hypothetical protein